jgi:hypothetical protein|tara:strand:+ start:969 stop:1385 length:417 start_codon:yes stop_codon:yes gene_type:complete
MIDDHYVGIFRNLADEAEARTGYEIPKLLAQYTILMLADHMRKTHWYPDPSFTENYLQINNSKSAKELADECLFISGVFPEYAVKRGVNITYYHAIGEMCYSRAATDLNKELFQNLSNYFVEVSKWTRNVVHNAMPFY